MTLFRVAVIAGAFLGAALGDAQAQSVPPGGTRAAPAGEPEMQFHLVRGAAQGCEPACTEWIAAEGKIAGSTPGRLRKVLARLGARRPPILIDSPGGSVDESLEMARLIRASGLDVAVGRTEYAICQPGDGACRKSRLKGGLVGRPVSQRAKCVSACVFVLAGGVRRIVGPQSFVGLHEIASFQRHSRILQTFRIIERREAGVTVARRKELVSERKIGEIVSPVPTSKIVYDRVERSFAALGVERSIMQLVRAAPPEKIYILTRAELQSTRIATDLEAPEAVLALVAPSATATAGPGAVPAPAAAAPSAGR